MSNFNKISFEVEGLHCKSCKILLETEIDILEGVSRVNVDYQSGKCWVEFDTTLISFTEIAKKIESFDYKVIQPEDRKESSDFKNQSGLKNFVIGLAVPAGLLVIAIFYFWFKKFGGFEILAQLNESNLSYGLLFLIGFLVSFHCIGMCGGLVVTYSAGLAVKDSVKKKSISWPHIQYNLGRLISYTIIGGILGGVGSFFAINPNFSGTVMIMAGFFMLLMAIALFTNFKALEKITPRMPSFVANFLYRQRHSNKPRGPLIIGLVNGFMPCGPLQAMQLYALGTGSFTRGALSMAVYALGTIPLMFGFGAVVSRLSHQHIKKVLKFSAVVVGILGLVMLNRGLVNFGLGVRSLIPKEAVSQVELNQVDDSGEIQTVRMKLTYRGYEPNVLYAKKGIPVRWIIDAQQISGCTNEIIMPTYNIRKPLVPGENIIEFTPEQSGEIKFSCWMQMVWGKFIVE